MSDPGAITPVAITPVATEMNEWRLWGDDRRSGNSWSGRGADLSAAGPQCPPHPAWSWTGRRDETELNRLRRLPAFLLLCLGVWLYAADSLLVATTMPTPVQEIGGLGFINPTVLFYLLASIIARPRLG